MLRLWVLGCRREEAVRGAGADEGAGRAAQDAEPAARRPDLRRWRHGAAAGTITICKHTIEPPTADGTFLQAHCVPRGVMLTLCAASRLPL